MNMFLPAATLISLASVSSISQAAEPAVVDCVHETMLKWRTKHPYDKMDVAAVEAKVLYTIDENVFEQIDFEKVRAIPDLGEAKFRSDIGMFACKLLSEIFENEYDSTFLETWETLSKSRQPIDEASFTEVGKIHAAAFVIVFAFSLCDRPGTFRDSFCLRK